MGTVTLASGNGQLSASWSAVAGAEQYEVYYSTINSIPASPTQTISVTSATIGSLANGTSYYIWVKPINANGSGSTNTVVSAKPLGVPAVPSLSPTEKQIHVTWTAVPGSDEYEVYYGTSSTLTTLWKTTNETGASITGLTDGTVYYVRIRAKNASGVSDYGTSESEISGWKAGLYRGNTFIGAYILTQSLSHISSNAITGDSFYIVLESDESLSATQLNYSNKTVGITLLGLKGERTISLNGTGNLFLINNNVTLTLDKNITLKGHKENDDSLVFANIGSKLVMNDGSKITGNNANYSGGGVYVHTNVTFEINGGTISGNTTSGFGGGVCCLDCPARRLDSGAALLDR
jgi:hypothetical protein